MRWTPKATAVIYSSLYSVGQNDDGLRRKRPAWTPTQLRRRSPDSGSDLQKSDPLAFLREVLVRNSPHCLPYFVVADSEICHL
jgi:hypothetical protein